MSLKLQACKIYLSPRATEFDALAVVDTATSKPLIFFQQSKTDQHWRVFHSVHKFTMVAEPWEKTP